VCAACRTQAALFYLPKAMDSGVLNNTNRSHELVDLVAKIGARVGVDFDFTNNRKLKESGFALEGVTVNGYVGKNGITVNVNSQKALNTVVGHEIAHVLEGSNLYEPLSTLITDYARGKGEYDTRLKQLISTYQNVEGYKGADGYSAIEKELVADLVGDYLFTDQDFVNLLSTENRSVFEKIFDEIKHLYKLATAGTKEARQLEEVKKMFEEVYRGEGKISESTRYSLTIKHTDGSVEELADARSLTNEQTIEYLKQAKAGKLRGESYIPVRADTPQVIIDTLEQVNEKIENRSMVMQVRKAQRAMAIENPGRQTKKYGDNVRKHGLSPEHVAEIIENIDNPSTLIYQTNRESKNGEPLPNNVAVVVEYNNGGKEGLAVIEFENPRDSGAIGTEFGETNYHTVVTVFEPDIERNGLPYDHVEELLSNPDNYELEIKRRQPEGSATREIHPNTSNELPYENSIRSKDVEVNKESVDQEKKSSTQHSLSVQDSSPARNTSRWEILGEDVEPRNADGQTAKAEAVKALDTEYTSAVQRGDMEAARKLVDEAAEAAGVRKLPGGGTVSYYHPAGKSFQGLETEKTRYGNLGYGYYLTPNGKYAAGTGTPVKMHLLPARLATENDRQITPEQVQTAADRFGVNISPSEIKGKSDSWILQTLMDKIVAKTNIPAEKLLPAFRKIFPYDGIQTQTETALWDPELLQSADPVLCDENGGVIPLSQRFQGEPSSQQEQTGREDVAQMMEQNPGNESDWDTIPVAGGETKTKYRILSSPKTIDENVAATNPKFKTGGAPYQQNCQRCTAAYVMRRKGYDVIAKPAIVNEKGKLSVKDPLYRNWKKIFKDADYEAYTDYSGGKEAIISEMNKWEGDGVAIVRILWSRAEGHVFIAEKTGNTIRFIDPQNGVIDCEKYFTNVLIGATIMARVDHLDPSELIELCIQNRGGKK